MIDLDELERLERYASLPPWDVDELRVLVNRPQEDCDDNFMQETDNDEAHRRDAEGGPSGGADCSAAT